MSNGIRYDSLLVRDLAAELHERFAGRAASLLRLDPDERTASLETDGGGLVFALHPLRGWIVESSPRPAPVLHRLHRSARIGRVHAPSDERIFRIDLAGSTSATRPIRALVIELMTNQMNLLALGAEERIVSALWPRSAGARELRSGAHYALPRPFGRAGADRPLEFDEWRELLADVERERAARELVRRIAYTSPLNAPAILGGATHEDGAETGDAGAPGDDAVPAGADDPPPHAPAAGAWLARAHGRYRAIVAGRRRPVLLDGAGGPAQPYPVPLAATPGRETESLLAAMAQAAGADAEPARAPAIAPERLDRLQRRLTRLEARLDSMRRELETAGPEAERLRARADLLLARLHEVPRGAGRVELRDFAGDTVELELDPALSPSDNAQALYSAARKRSRAADALPGILSKAERERDELASLVERATRGAASEEEVDAALPPEPAGGSSGEEELAPYRRYTTSGGHEVRVGRSGKANDELTFHHSTPNDVWLHARDTAGAHVILRWNDAEANPPARDLAEAAVLAALHSRARTSGTVPVDWTRRKYVRKPRKSPPGLVLPDRVSTVFVEPDPALERRLRKP